MESSKPTREKHEQTATANPKAVAERAFAGDHKFHSRDKAKSRASRVLPWIYSIAGHALLLGLAFLIAGEIARRTEEPPGEIISTDLGDAPVEAETELLLSAVTSTTETTVITLPIASDATDTSAFMIPGQQNFSSGLGLAGPTALGSVEFAGLGGGGAKEIVFVVDASGSMIGAFPVVLAELTRSLTNLSPAQSYSIIFFQKEDALVAPPLGTLAPATNEQVRKTLSWVRENVVPSGRSNPMRALERALALQPQVIFLLSSNITGSGQYEVDLEELLGNLDQLNPIDTRTARRRTRINCIQFLDPDPLDALREISQRHGGAKGYRFLGRSELGLAPGS